MFDFFYQKLKIRKFAQHRHGAAAVEFLLSLPMVMIVFAILHDVSQMFLVKSNLIRASSTIADILSQIVDPSELKQPPDNNVGAGIASDPAQKYLIMGEVLMFPDSKPKGTYGSDQKSAPIGVTVRAFGTDGKFECLYNTRGLPMAKDGITATPGSTQPEVVVAVALKFKPPLLSGLQMLGPKMVLVELARRYMRGVVFGKTGTVIIRPLYSDRSPINTNVLCVPAD